MAGDMEQNDYYVYMYIDPRNNQEFYYGKGRRKRKLSHLNSRSDSAKSDRIRAIEKAGRKPIIKVIAAGLTEDQAFLIEATLLWRLGKFTDNRSAGHFSKKFRDQDTLHIDLPGFDFDNEIYRFNVGEHKSKTKIGRKWEDYIKYGFICSGGGPKWIQHIKDLNKDDIVTMYLTGKGFVGIGRVMTEAVPAIDFKYKGKSILDINTLGSYDSNKSNLNKCQWMSKVRWIKKVQREDAKKVMGISANLRGTKASISKNTKLIEFINREFKVKLKDLVK